MSKNRKPIDMTALAAVARPQADPVAQVLREVPSSAPSPATVRPAREGKGASSSSRQASRSGKVGIQYWTDPETRKALKLYAAKTDRTLDDIMREALEAFMKANKIA